MSAKKHLTFVLMDAPYENARTVTALRLIDVAVRRGHDVTVFAYEGAVSLAFARQAKHANAVHGRTAEEEDHPLPREWIAALLEAAAMGRPWRRLWVVADGWAVETLNRVVERLQGELPMAVQALDPAAMGWLQAEAHCFVSSGLEAVPWTLWGLAAPEVLASAAFA